MRLRKSLFLPVFSTFLCVLPLYAQVHGVPASVTSLGFGGNFNPAPGVPASVTSLGPNGYSFSPPLNGPCCFTSFGQPFSPFPGNQLPTFNFRSFHHHNHFAPIFTPAYSVSYAYPVAVPVPVPYASDQYASDEEDDAYASDAPPLDRLDRRHLRGQKRVAEESDSAENPDGSQPAAEEPVTAQPTTVLVFKDGHQLNVENYAIVGGTLFEFTNGLTHKFQLADLDLLATQKVNDDRGVEFHTPSSGGQ